MTHELFALQPDLELLEGIRVSGDTELHYKNDRVDQTLKKLLLVTLLEDSGSNGLNSFKSRSYMSVNLNPGDILLFDRERGYYLPRYPVCSIPDAAEAVAALEQLPRFREVTACSS